MRLGSALFDGHTEEPAGDLFKGRRRHQSGDMLEEKLNECVCVSYLHFDQRMRFDQRHQGTHVAGLYSRLADTYEVFPRSRPEPLACIHHTYRVHQQVRTFFFFLNQVRHGPRRGGCTVQPALGIACSWTRLLSGR